MKNPLVILLVLANVTLLLMGNAAAKKSSLQLEYTLLAQRNEMVIEVEEKGSLKSGDRIHIMFKPLQKCYVYIINQDAEGKMYTLFPGTQENNKVLKKGKEYSISGNNQNFQLDMVTGKEFIYIAVAKDPVKDIEKLMNQEDNANIVKDIFKKLTKSLGTATPSKGEKNKVELANGQMYEGHTKKLSGKNSFLYTIEFEHLESSDSIINVTTRGLKKKTKKKPTDMTGTAGQQQKIDAP